MSQYLEGSAVLRTLDAEPGVGAYLCRDCTGRAVGVASMCGVWRLFTNSFIFCFCLEGPGRDMRICEKGSFGSTGIAECPVWGCLNV